jgi:hypothetical protein
MTDLITGILGSLCICSIGVILGKLCSIHKETRNLAPQPHYVLISKEHYETLKTEQKYTTEQPQLPDYSEHD